MSEPSDLTPREMEVLRAAVRAHEAGEDVTRAASDADWGADDQDHLRLLRRLADLKLLSAGVTEESRSVKILGVSVLGRLCVRTWPRDGPPPEGKRPISLEDLAFMLELSENLKGWPDAALADPGDSGPEQAIDQGNSGVWRPSRSGPLTMADMAAATQLLEDLGRWVELLPATDIRLPEAEVTRDILRGQIRLGTDADRVHVRRCVQTTTRLLADEIRQAGEGLAESLREAGEDGGDQAREALGRVVEAARGDGAEVGWQEAADSLDGVVGEIGDDPDAPAHGMPERRSGRGDVVVARIETVALGAIGSLVATGILPLLASLFNLFGL